MGTRSSAHRYKFAENKKDEVDIMIQGLGKMIAWHEKQHPNHQQCDYCVPLEEYVQSIGLIKMYVENYLKLAEENK